MSKVICTLIILCFLTQLAQAAEITECFIDYQNQNNAILESNLQVEIPAYTFTTAAWEDPQFLNTAELSKKSCELLDWVNKKVNILSFTLGTAGYLCEKSPNPYLLSAGVLMSISGYGIQMINLYFQDDMESCKKQEIEARAKKAFKYYLENKGATVN